MAISHKQLEDLAHIIIKNIKLEFDLKHLSGNLVNTLQVVNNQGNIQVIIPAPTYNMLLYQTQHIIVHDYRGSYASKLDTEGSNFMVYPYGTRKGAYRAYPRNHINYVDDVIAQSLREWLGQLSQYQISQITVL